MKGGNEPSPPINYFNSEWLLAHQRIKHCNGTHRANSH